MSLLHLPDPPRFPLVDKEGMLTAHGREWYLRLWRKLGEMREIPSESIAPNVLKNVSNNATADSVDAGASATVRVYGPGGVGSSWDRFRDGRTEATYSAVTFTGKAYTTRYYLGFDVLTRTWTISTSFKDVTGDNKVTFSVLTKDPGGGGGSSGGGGAGGGGEGGVGGDGGGYGLIL